MPYIPKYLAKEEAAQSKLGRWLGGTFDEVIATKKSNAWFAKIFLGLDGGEKRVYPSSMTMFNLYFFRYRSKLYEEGRLPFFDSNPLSFIIDYNPTKGEGGTPLFLGLNLHYIPARIRYNFIYDVLRVNEGNIRRMRPVKIPYPWVKNRWPHLLNMVHSYIPNRMSGIYRIPIIEWERAIYLKSSEFVGATNSQIMKMAREYMDAKKDEAAPKQKRYDGRTPNLNRSPDDIYAVKPSVSVRKAG